MNAETYSICDRKISAANQCEFIMAEDTGYANRANYITPFKFSDQTIYVCINVSQLHSLFIYKPFYRENDCQYLPIFVLFCLHVQNVNTFRSITLIH